MYCHIYSQTTSTQCMTMIMITIMEGHQGIPNHKELKIKIEWLKKKSSQQKGLTIHEKWDQNVV